MAEFLWLVDATDREARAKAGTAGRLFDWVGVLNARLKKPRIQWRGWPTAVERDNGHRVAELVIRNAGDRWQQFARGGGRGAGGGGRNIPAGGTKRMTSNLTPALRRRIVLRVASHVARLVHYRPLACGVAGCLGTHPFRTLCPLHAASAVHCELTALGSKVRAGECTINEVACLAVVEFELAKIRAAKAESN